MIELSHVSKRFGDETAVDDISLRVPKGKFCALVGTSGCGKSTTLRMINRLIEHSEGDIILDGQAIDVYDPVKLRRRIGYVIQHTGLFPHWSVARNIGSAFWVCDSGNEALHDERDVATSGFF